jgi:hypothetical protein
MIMFCMIIAGHLSAFSQQSILDKLKSHGKHQFSKRCKNKRDKSETVKSKTKLHRVVFDLEDGFWNQFTFTNCEGIDLSFEANIQITTIGNQVYIEIPALNFTIPETQNQCYLDTASIPPPPGGYVTTIDGFLPNKILPNSVFPLTFTIQSSEYPAIQDPPVAVQGINYELQIDTEGRIKIAGQGFNPIPPGRHSLLPTSVSYIVNHSNLEVPKNVPVSLVPSTPNLNCRINQFLEIQMSSFEGGRVAFTFGDNSEDPLSCLIKNKVAIADVVTKKERPTLKFRVPQHTYDPSTIGYGTGTVYQAGVESNVAINPTNIDNIVSAFSVRVGSAPYPGTFPETRFACIAQTTFDGGKTWSSQIRVDTAQLICRGDVRLRADPFGNFWVMFDCIGSSYDIETDTGVSQAIFVSSDGGLTWNAVAEPTPPNHNNFGFDYPMMHWGGDGNGGIAMYFDWMLYDFDENGNSIFFNYLAALPVKGLGGPFGPIQIIHDFPQIDGLIGFGEITATPDGTVVYAASDSSGPRSGFGPPLKGLENHTYLIVHKGGLNNFTPAGFSEPRLQSYNTIGMNNSSAQHSVVWQATRGILPSVGTQGLDYDPKTGRLYSLTLSERHPRTVTEIALPGDSSDQASLYFNQGIMNLSWSYDFGKTWSKPIPIRDSRIGQAGICTLNVDRTTGNIACGWYDPREDAKNQQQIKWFATVLAPPKDQK